MKSCYEDDPGGEEIGCAGGDAAHDGAATKARGFNYGAVRRRSTTR
jgi:hypothetical protein